MIYFLFLPFWLPWWIIAHRQQQGCAQFLIVTVIVFHSISLQQTRNLTSDRTNSFLVGSQHSHVSVHSTATMPPRRPRGGQAAGAPSPAPDPSPRAQRTPGPSRFSTSYGSSAMYAAARSSTSSALGGIGNAVRSVQEMGAADGQGRANPRPSRAGNQSAQPSNNGGSGDPAPVPPPRKQQPSGPAGNDQRMFLDIHSPHTISTTLCVSSTNFTFSTNQAAQGIHPVAGPRLSNHRTNLAVVIRGRLDSCRYRFTRIRRLIGALLRRANSTMVQTSGRPEHRKQADGPPRHRILILNPLISTIPLTTTTRRIHCNMIRPAARLHGLHRAIGPSAGQIASHKMEDLGGVQLSGLTVPGFLYETILE